MPPDMFLVSIPHLPNEAGSGKDVEEEPAPVSWEVMAETLGMPPNARRKSFTKIEQMQGVESNAAALVSLQVGDTEEKARFGDTLNVDSTPETTKANLYRQVR